MEATVSDEELVARFAGHPLDHDSAAHYRGRLERRLLLNRCGQCALWHHPPRPVCPGCWSSEVKSAPVAGSGTIHLTVYLHQGPPAPGVDYAVPYPVVTVELDEQAGLRFTSTVVGADQADIHIGDRVVLAWADRAGAPLPVFKLAPLDAA